MRLDCAYWIPDEAQLPLVSFAAYCSSVNRPAGVSRLPLRCLDPFKQSAMNRVAAGPRLNEIDVSGGLQKDACLDLAAGIAP